MSGADPAFARGIDAGMAFLHAERRDSLPTGPGEDYHRWRLETPAGALLVHPHETWVDCRFEDPSLAKAQVTVNRDQLNPSTGRWNWYFHRVPGLPEAKAMMQHIAFFIHGNRGGAGEYYKALAYTLDKAQDGAHEAAHDGSGGGDPAGEPGDGR